MLFILSSYLSQLNQDNLKAIIALGGTFGKIVYIFLLILAVVIAPLETLPLLPIAVIVWGRNLAAIYSIIGWFLGALIAFALARVFGQKLVCKIMKKNDLEEWRKLLPKKHIFWTIVLARLILPVDIASYLVGLFTNISWTSYITASLIGIIPFGFFYAYGATLPVIWQLIIGLILLAIIIFGYEDLKKRYRYIINIGS